SYLPDSGRRGAHEDDRGNDGPWTPRKTKSRFSPGAHSPWKSLRDSHIPTVATKQWKWKTKNRFSHFPLPRVGSSDQIQKGGLAAELRSSSRLIVRLENAPRRLYIRRAGVGIVQERQIPGGCSG